MKSMLFCLLWCVGIGTIFQNSDPAAAYFQKAALQVQEGHFKDAIQSYSAGIQSENKPNPRSYNDRGFAKIHIGEFEGALLDFEQALKIDPNYIGECYNGGIYFKMAVCYEKTELPEKASQCYEKQILQFEKNGGGLDMENCLLQTVQMPF